MAQTANLHCFFLASLLLIIASSYSTHALSVRPSTQTSQRPSVNTFAQKEKKGNSLDSDEDEVYFIEGKERKGRFAIIGTTSTDNKESSTASAASEANYMDDLTPPPINIKRDSILFSENPSTKRNDEVAHVWKSCRINLPAILTGAWPWRPPQMADENPIGGLYNMIFVRIPVIGVAVVYIQNIIQHHPLVLDIGRGQFEVSPVIVLSVLALILA